MIKTLVRLKHMMKRCLFIAEINCKKTPGKNSILKFLCLSFQASVESWLDKLPCRSNCHNKKAESKVCNMKQ